MFSLIKIELHKILEKIRTKNLIFKPVFLTSKNKEIIDYKTYRMAVAQILFDVLTDKILTREALLKFPEDIKDPSIEASWHALCHLEADEDIRRRDLGYANEQNDFIEMIAFTLQKGEELPENIINSYKKYHENALIPHAKSLKGIINKLTRFLNI